MAAVRNGVGLQKPLTVEERMASGQACPAPMRQSKTMSNFEDAAQDALERSNTSPTRMSSGFRITNSEGKRASFQINEEPPKRSSGPAAARRSSGPAAAGTPEAAGERLIDLRPYVDRSPYVVHELQVRTHAPSSLLFTHRTFLTPLLHTTYPSHFLPLCARAQQRCSQGAA